MCFFFGRVWGGGRVEVRERREVIFSDLIVCFFGSIANYVVRFLVWLFVVVGRFFVFFVLVLLFMNGETWGLG